MQWLNISGHFYTATGKEHFILLKKNFIIVQIQLSPFSPTHPHVYPQSYATLTLSMCPLHMIFGDPSPFFPLFSPYPIPTSYCPFVLNFNVSGCILLACLFCSLGSTYRWDHMVFVFGHLAHSTYHNTDFSKEQRKSNYSFY